MSQLGEGNLVVGVLVALAFYNSVEVQQEHLLLPANVVPLNCTHFEDGHEVALVVGGVAAVSFVWIDLNSILSETS